MKVVNHNSCVRCKCGGYLQALAQHSSGEVVSHELVIDETHYMVPKENPCKAPTQQHLPHQCLKPTDTHR